jgi:hypothetical protein
MGLEKLEKYKTKFKYFENTISSLQSYLQNKIKNPIEVINPDKVSQALDIPSSDALFLLSLAEKEHLLTRIFFVYTKNHDFLGEFPKRSTIPTKIEDENGRYIDEGNYYIDVAFKAT